MADDSQLATANDTSACDVTGDIVTLHVMWVTWSHYFSLSVCTQFTYHSQGGPLKWDNFVLLPMYLQSLWCYVYLRVFLLRSLPLLSWTWWDWPWPGWLSIVLQCVLSLFIYYTPRISKLLHTTYEQRIVVVRNMKCNDVSSDVTCRHYWSRHLTSKIVPKMTRMHRVRC